MARELKSLGIINVQSIESQDFGYSVPSNTVTTPTLNITNRSSNAIELSVFINNGDEDYLLVKNKIAAGVGKTWRVIELHDQKLNAGFSVKVQCSTADEYNAFLSGSEISDN